MVGLGWWEMLRRVDSGILNNFHSNQQIGVFGEAYSVEELFVFIIGCLLCYTQ